MGLVFSCFFLKELEGPLPQETLTISSLHEANLGIFWSAEVDVRRNQFLYEMLTDVSDPRGRCHFFG